MKRTNVHLFDEQLEELGLLAKDQKVKTSELIRRAIWSFLFDAKFNAEIRESWKTTGRPPEILLSGKPIGEFMDEVATHFPKGSVYDASSGERIREFLHDLREAMSKRGER